MEENLWGQGRRRRWGGEGTAGKRGGGEVRRWRATAVAPSFSTRRPANREEAASSLSEAGKGRFMETGKVETGGGEAAAFRRCGCSGEARRRWEVRRRRWARVLQGRGDGDGAGCGVRRVGSERSGD
jgi:hypothetical protein